MSIPADGENVARGILGEYLSGWTEEEARDLLDALEDDPDGDEEWPR